MSTDVNAAVTTWNDACATAKTEVASLEATLKADYNKYVDSLAAYVERVKAANDIRTGYANILGNEDVENDIRTRNEFLSLAVAPIENSAAKYILDSQEGDRVTRSLRLVRACDANELLERKFL